MPKSGHIKRSEKFLSENFIPFLNAELKNALSLEYIGLFNFKDLLENNKKLMPFDLFAQSNAFYNKSLKILDQINELTTIMSLLREFEKGYPAQPQKITPEIYFMPIIEKYRQKAKIQGMSFICTSQFPTKAVYGGKVEFEYILELILSNALEESHKKSIEVKLEIIDTKICFSINTSESSDVYDIKIDQAGAYRYPKETLRVIRTYLVRKFVEKLKGSIVFENGIRIEVPAKI